jgi:hypothetical protein
MIEDSVYFKDKGIKNRHNDDSQKGIAIIIALITLLIISIMAVSISFVSNTDYSTMSSYKAGQEAFLAAERCTVEARKTFEIEGIETLVALQTIDKHDPLELTLPNGAVCRSGPRFYDSGSDDSLPFVNLPEGVKSIQRSLKHTSLPSGGKSSPVAAALSFEVLGKDSQDKDKDDKDDDINTGVHISVGIETFLPGGGSNVY